MVHTPYTLIGSDDFDFSTSEARRGIVAMGVVLKYGHTVHIVGGRCNERPYEGFLEYVPGEYIKEHRLDETSPYSFCLPHPVWRVDIIANYFLAHTQVLRDVPWDEKIRPIGGEHVDFFLDLRAAGKIVSYLPGVNINTQPYDASKQDSCYKAYRQRALTTGHELMKKKRNIKQYISFDGGIS
jgi:hypothetical protein